MKTISILKSGAVIVEDQQFADLGSVPGAVRAQKLINVEALQIMEPFELVIKDGLVQPGEPGDWILQGAAGDVYVVRADVFQKTYRPITE